MVNFIQSKTLFFMEYRVCPFQNVFQLSVVEYDPGMHDLQTTSLHYFEENAFKVNTLYGPVIGIV